MRVDFEKWFNKAFTFRNHRMIEWCDGNQHIVGETEKVKNLCKFAWEAAIDAAAEAEKEKAENICENCSTPLPEGCNGLFLKDGDSCKLNLTHNAKLTSPNDES